MRVIPCISSLVAIGCLAFATSSHAGGPFDGKTFKGRIAYSADGNFNDPDDWAASPVVLAILGECGVKDRLVHFDYNCIMPKTDPEWEKKNTTAVLGTAERYGYDMAVFRDCQKDLPGALASIASAIDESTADNPLYFVVAGPMEVPFLAIQKSDPGKRQHVYCISHSRWNDGFSSKKHHDFFTYNKRSVIESGVNWVQIRDQNKLLSTSPYGRPGQPEEFRPYFWMRDSKDPRVVFQWEQMQVSTRPDPSDAGMVWFLMTGDEDCDPAKLKRLIEDHVVPVPVAMRRAVRIEAENFAALDGFQLEDRNDKQASHSLNARSTGSSGRIATRYAQPYAAPQGLFDVEVRYFDEPNERCRFVLKVNGAAQEAPFETAGSGAGWTSHTIRDVSIRSGDEIAVEARGATSRLDYVQLDYKSP